MEHTGSKGQVQLASGANLAVGLWLLIAPFVLAYNVASDAATWNDVIVGIVVASLAAIRAFGAYSQGWLSWSNVALGVWLIITPFALGYSEHADPLWNDIIVGVIVASLGTWSALESTRRGGPA
jgi:hypothetical protein